jgi:oligopeptidase A
VFINFDVDLDNAYVDLAFIIKKSKQEIKELLQIKDKTYKNFVKKFQDISQRVDLFFTPISHVDSVINSDKSSDIYESLLPMLSKYSDEISQNEDLYRAFVEIKKNELDTLGESELLLLDNEIRDFVLGGVALSSKNKDSLKEINLALKQLSKSFSKNILDEIKEYQLLVNNFEDVKDIPKNDLENAKIIVDGETKYKFTMQAPSYMSYMTYGGNRSIREKLYKKHVTLGVDNGIIIDDILELREKKAKLLGFDSYSDFSIASKSVKSKELVLEFLYDIASKAKKMANTDILTLEEFAGIKLESYDVAYYSELYRKEKLDLDSNKYRAYFEKNRVVNALMVFLKDMFDLEYKKVDNQLVWHNDVTVYEFAKNGKIVSRLYMDLEAREDKKSGAWMNNWQSRHLDCDGKIKASSAFIVCNFSPSIDGVSLLRHSDVVTLFHEMGHAIHHMFSGSDDIFTSGVNGVAWDVIEFPSQFLENFAFNKEMLKNFAVHYENGNVLSDDMIDRLLEARNFQSAYSTIRQLEFAIFDIMLHGKLYNKDAIQELLDSIRSDISPLVPPKYNKFQNSFSHIFSGAYASGYYSYKWAEVMSADLYVEVTKSGMINRELMSRYFDTILTYGGSRDMNSMFFSILGREPQTDALLKLDGIY